MKVRYLDPRGLPQRAATSVVFLVEEPIRPHRVIAEIELEDRGLVLTRDEVKARLVAEAAKLGGDAVYPWGDLHDSPQFWFGAAPILVGAPDSHRYIARVIVYTTPGAVPGPS